MSFKPQVQAFEYPSVRGPGAGQVWMVEAESRDESQNDDLMTRVAQAREIGRAEGESLAKTKFEDELRRERNRIGAALEQFQRERKTYFENIEAEVVQLALAVARRILHREANVDPDLLKGLVRYTLEKLRDGTKVQLKVHPSEVAGFTKHLGNRAEICGDEETPPGICVLVTEVGTTAVSVDEQLKEIERGLADLLAQRPSETR